MTTTADAASMQFTLGDALRKSRTQPKAPGQHRLSQEAMAEHLHVSRPTIGAWEKDGTPPPFWAVTAWSKITGWPMDWFEEAAVQSSPLIHVRGAGEQLDLFGFAA